MAYIAGPQSPRYLVDTTYVGSEDGDYPDLDSAVAALAREPGEWARVLVRDGTYVQQWGAPDKVQVQAINPGAVTVERPTDAAGGAGSALYSYTGTYLIQGINFRLPLGADTGSGTYAFHGHCDGGPAVANDCDFLSLSTQHTESAGADVYPSSITTWRGCTFHSKTNFHGWPDNDRALRWMMFDCDAQVTGFDNKSSGMADEFWLIGGSATEVNLNGAGLHGIIDQAAAPTVNVTGGATFEWYDPEVHTVPSIWDRLPA